MRVGELNSHLLQSVPEPFDTCSLLGILARSQETNEQLDKIRVNDAYNNIALGIGKIIDASRSGRSSAGSTVIKALGSALHSGLSGAGDLEEKFVTSLGKATGIVIHSSGEAFEHVSRGAGGFFHDIIGGLSGSLLWGAIILLTLFCLYQYIKHKQLLCFATSSSRDNTKDNDDDTIDEHDGNGTFDLERV